jgi:hypothetical protein
MRRFTAMAVGVDSIIKVGYGGRSLVLTRKRFEPGRR